MILSIQEYGAKLAVSNGMFNVKIEEEKHKVPVDQVDLITLTKATGVTVDALMLAMRNDIDVIFTDRSGVPVGRVWNNRFGSISVIRINQLTFVSSSEGIRWALYWIEQKMGRQLKLLRNLLNNAGSVNEKNKRTLIRLQEINVNIKNMEALNTTETRKRIMGLEGVFSRDYFMMLGNFLPAGFRFTTRSRQPAQDPFNALLNYFYGIIYSKVQSALIKAGVDPYLAVLHRNDYNRPSLVFDVIEPFRPWVDEIIVWMVNQGFLCEKCFDEHQGGVYLNKEGKGIAVPVFDQFFDQVPGGEVRRTRYQIIDYQATRLATAIKNNQ